MLQRNRTLNKEMAKNAEWRLGDPVSWLPLALKASSLNLGLICLSHLLRVAGCNMTVTRCGQPLVIVSGKNIIWQPF